MHFCRKMQKICNPNDSDNWFAQLTFQSMQILLSSRKNKKREFNYGTSRRSFIKTYFCLSWLFTALVDVFWKYVFLKIRTANRQRSWSRIRGYGVCCHATIVSGMRGFQKWNGQKRSVFVNTFNFHSVSRIVFVLMASDQNAVFPPIDV